jgi:nucleoredoxin
MALVPEVDTEGTNQEPSPLLRLFGPKLQYGGSATTRAKQFAETEDSLSGKIVGVYFSGHWCPPCRGFTPKLIETYYNVSRFTERDTTSDTNKDFEVVFVSSDRDQAAYDRYVLQMPWLTLPYSERTLQSLLMKRFRVPGLPYLVICDFDSGDVINLHGRHAITEDPKATKFPWPVPSLLDLLGPELWSSSGKVETAEALKPSDILTAKVHGCTHRQLALYFGASTCQFCKDFTPHLIKLYEVLRQNTKSNSSDFEFIFIGRDTDESRMWEYFKEMPWLAMPYERRAEANWLKEIFEIDSIPCLVTIEGNGKVINRRAQHHAIKDVDCSNFPWPPLACEELSQTIECNGFDINEKPAIILFMFGLDQREREADDSGDESSARSFRSGRSGGESRAGADETIDLDEKENSAKIGEGEGDDEYSNNNVQSDKNHENDEGGSSTSGDNDNSNYADDESVAATSLKTSDVSIGGGPGADDEEEELYFAYSREAENALLDVATEHVDIARASDSTIEMLFFTARYDQGAVSVIRQLCGLKDVSKTSPTLVLIDIPNNGSFYKFSSRSRVENITPKTISTFIADYESGLCTRHQMAPLQNIAI